MLNNAKVGCHVGDQCLAALGYADELVLLALTVWAMRVLLNICDDFAVSYDVVFNAAKSKCEVTKPSCCRNMALERIPTSPVIYKYTVLAQVKHLQFVFLFSRLLTQKPTL